jgi:hypothetical protein
MATKRSSKPVKSSKKPPKRTRSAKVLESVRSLKTLGREYTE